MNMYLYKNKKNNKKRKTQRAMVNLKWSVPLYEGPSDTQVCHTEHDVIRHHYFNIEWASFICILQNHHQSISS